MALIAISDLHISGATDPLYGSLLQLIRNRVRSGDTLVLAGDVFDLFVGNKEIFRERYAEFVTALREAGSRGVKIHYIEGNHDFLLKQVFAEVPNFHLSTSEIEFDLEGKRFFFSHGDTADRTDYGYRLLRLFFRSPVMRTFVQLAPGPWIDWIGQHSSRKSSHAKPRLPTGLPVDQFERLRKVYRNYAAERISQGYDFVVMGHCHDLDEMMFRVGERQGQYINIGYPRVHGSYVSWTEGEDRLQREALPSAQSS
jgi:UDP-2,3-diacylglucosamine hydrolase